MTKAMTQASMNKLSLSEARQIALSAQGLASQNQFGKGLKGTAKAIAHLGYVQIDSISVVERAHHHVLWSRVKDYSPEYLPQLLEKKKIFEYWSHAAAYLPMGDFRFSLPRKQLYASGDRQWFAPTSEHLAMKKMVLNRIQEEGPLTSRDFANLSSSRPTGWWDWKPAKKALEHLFMEGRLMVSSRKGFDKAYDLTERVLPSSVDTSFPSPAEHAKHLIMKAAIAHGLVRINEIAYQRSSMKKLIEIECKKLLDDGELEELKVEGATLPYLALAKEWKKSLQQPIENEFHILSPFDNQVIQRKRLKELFGFEYTIECYVPENKRQFGYFCLPILKGGTFLGRIDAKADRKEKLLLAYNLYPEKGQGSKSAIWGDSQEILHQFAKFNGCNRVEKSFKTKP